MEGAAKRRLPPFLSLRCGWNFIPNSETETFSQLPYRAALGARPRRRGDRMKRREFMSSSERVPGRGRREFEIADIRAQPYPHPRADRDHDDVVHRQRRHSQAADQVSRTLDAREALVDSVGGGQIVYKHHRARAVDAEVIAK